MALSRFARSAASIGRDGFRIEALIGALAVAVVGTWLAWFLLAEIPVYEVTAAGRIEVVHSAHHIDAPASGRVVAAAAALGRRVEAGEVLFELDADAERLDADEQRALISSVEAQRDALQREIDAAEAALAAAVGSLEVAVEEARARQQASRAVASRSRQQASEAGALARRGLISRAERRDAAARARESSAAARAQTLAAERARLEREAELDEHRLQLEELRRARAALDGQLETGRVKLRRLEREIERRTLRAPVSGVVGEAANLPIGSLVAEGDRLATVVPDGELRVVGAFTPRVLGRIRRGQIALFRPEAFPSTQYGAVRARVEHVSSEVRDGAIRVELALLADAGSAIPQQHGLPGVIEVEVERVSPAALVWRALGRGLHQEAAPEPIAMERRR